MRVSAAERGQEAKKEPHNRHCSGGKAVTNPASPVMTRTFSAFPLIFFLFIALAHQYLCSYPLVGTQDYLFAFLITPPLKSPFSLRISNKLIITLVAVISPGHTKWFPVLLHKLNVLWTCYTLIDSIAENCRGMAHVGTSYHIHRRHNANV